jgi:hypothetical protein
LSDKLSLTPNRTGALALYSTEFSASWVRLEAVFLPGFMINRFKKRVAFFVGFLISSAASFTKIFLHQQTPSVFQGAVV